MTKNLELYKCKNCGNIIEVVIAGDGELFCCGEPLEKIQAKSVGEEMLGEKHVPFVEKEEHGFSVRIGSVPHPMVEEHYIMFIEAVSFDKKYLKRKYLFPNEEPVLKLKCDCDNIMARELCNIHGLWITKEWSEQDD